MSENMHKSTTSNVSAQMYMYRVASCLKLTDVTFVLIFMFSEQFSLKVILKKVQKLSYFYIVGCYDIFIISVHGCHTALWYWVLLYVACWHYSWVLYMEWHVIQYQNLSISHMYILTRHWNSLFSFHRQLLKWIVLSVVVTVQCHQCQLPVLHLNVNTEMGQGVSVSQNKSFILQVMVVETWQLPVLAIA
jgi:hypothetical protein